MTIDPSVVPPGFVVNGDVSEPTAQNPRSAFDMIIAEKYARIAELEAEIAAQQQLINELMDRELTE